MSSGSREKILSTLRQSLGRGPLDEARVKELESNMRRPKNRVVPARGQVKGAKRKELFIKMAEACDCTVVQVETLADVPTAAVEFLRNNNLPASIRVAPQGDLKNLNWSENVSFGLAEDDHPVGLIKAWAGFAESGTLMVLSGPEGPTTLNFLPDTFVAVLEVKDLLGTYEEGWKKLRGRKQNGTFMPRTVNWITGPSRSADIELTLQLGVHGPRRVHILLVDEKR